MPRPRTYLEVRRTTAVRLPVSLHDRLRTEADLRLVSANLLIERAISEFLDRLPPVEVSAASRS
jgi:predicted HicB family RNase H-like nuclease